MIASVYVIATCDTKGAELAFVADLIRASGVAVTTIDVGTLSAATMNADVGRDEVLRCHPLPLQATDCADRGSAIGQMGEALREYLKSEVAQGRVQGVLGLGGSGGTSLITTAMRALPIGLPKLMVSTVASGNVGPYVDCSDITMMYSVVDVAGLNVVSEVILANAAHAMAGMVRSVHRVRSARPALGMTMFGVTTPCVDRVRAQLEHEGFDCLVFHATGSGGRAMEQLVGSGLISGILDITTTEVADEVVGGVFACGPDRFDSTIDRGVPFVISLGAMDMVNFGALETVPERFRNRRLHVHNAQVTLMRTSPDENREIATWIANKLNRSIAPLRVIVPLGGVSSLDVPGQPFADPIADAALFNELEQRLNLTPDRQLIRLPYAINDPEFAAELLLHFRELYESQRFNADPA